MIYSIKNLNPIIKYFLRIRVIKKKNIYLFHNKTRDKKIKVLKCIKTGIIFLEKVFTNDKYYKNAKTNFNLNYFNFNSYKSKVLDDDSRRFFQFKKYIKKNILDFGCGYGGFLNYARSISQNVYGYELSKHALNYIKKKYKNVSVIDSYKNINLKFNLITLFHVLEHIPSQVNILRDLKKILTSNGKIIVEVPSAHDFLLKFEKLNDFKNFTFWSEHLVLHTEVSLKLILKKAGFSKIKIIHYQRYNFNNHLGWFINKTPGGHEYFKRLGDHKIIDDYNKFVIRKNFSDTLIAIASK